jgi:hypothetical protein
MRGALIVLLIVIGGILTIPGSIGLWQDRAILDEDSFIKTVDDAFEQEEVQTVLAGRLTDGLMEYLEVRDRIGNALVELDEREENLPEGLVLLEGPLTGVAREAIYRVALRLIEAQPLEEVREAALRGVHRYVVALVNDDNDFLRRLGEDVVIDLKPLLEAIVREVGGERADRFLDRVELPEDAGVIKLGETTDISIVWDSVHLLDRSYPIFAAIAVVLFGIAIAISRSRRLALIGAGAATAIAAAALLLVVSQPMKQLLTDAVATPDGKSATVAIYDVLTDSFKRQQSLLVLVGVTVVAGATLAGESSMARAVRSVLRRPEEQPEDEITMGEWVRQRALALRVAGLAVGGLFLVAWPDPSTRLTATVLIFIAVYLALIFIVSSESRWAEAIRSPVAAAWSRFFRLDDRRLLEEGRRSPAHWIALRAAWFRLAALVIGAAYLIIRPDVSLTTILVVLAVEMLLFALIDIIVNRVSERR